MAIRPISVRLDDDVRAALEEDAQGQHIGLATYLRRLAAERAALLRKTCIRTESSRIGELVAVNPEAPRQRGRPRLDSAWVQKNLEATAQLGDDDASPQELAKLIGDRGRLPWRKF